MPVGREDVVACYQAMLGRMPESEQTITNHMRSANLRSLMQGILASAEFQQKSGATVSGRQLPNLCDPRDVEVDGNARQIQRLIKHTQNVWSKYGNDEPYWSVLTGDQYKSGNLTKDAIEEFYSSGKSEYDFMLKALERNGYAIKQSGTVVDIGCGLGRVGFHFASRFGKYIGVDISRPHLTTAKSRFDQFNIKNATFEILPDFMDKTISADFIFSIIVLQHNPPPVMKLLVDRMCASLKRGGIIYFQVPTLLSNYKFELDNYLKNLPTDNVMEMHVLPQKSVFEIFHKNNCVCIEVFEHNMIGPIGESSVFIAKKL